MQYAPPVNRPPILNVVASVSAVPNPEEDRFGDRFDVGQHFLPDVLEIGDTRYPLRSQFFGRFFPGGIASDGQFAIPQLAAYFVGKGRTFDDAFVDWKNQIHGAFQELYSKRPFEMTADELELWQTLECVIDVPTYRNTMPLTIRQIGKVTQCRPLPQQVEWEDGHKESVRPEQMPAEFAGYKAGQPFEAMVVREPVNLQLLKVSYVKRIKPLPRMTEDEREALLRNTTSTASLPNADWD